MWVGGGGWCSGGGRGGGSDPGGWSGAFGDVSLVGRLGKCLG